MRPGRESGLDGLDGSRAHGAAGFSSASLPPFRGEATALTFVSKATILDEGDVARAIARIAHEIVERNKGARNVVLVGVRTRGVHVATRLADRIEAIEGVRPPTGVLDIGLYRDDIGLRDPVAIAPTQIPAIDGKVVVLVDDVLYTGRTTRAALDALMDVGRPRSVQFAVLVDRGHRELPIRADYVGKNLPTRKQEEVAVHLREVDGEDRVLLGEVEPVKEPR